MPGLFMAVFWLALFGSSFNPVNLVPTQIGGITLSPVLVGQIKSAISSVFGGAANYITFLTAGIITLIVIINMAYGGIDIVLDRQLGYLNSLLSAPISRASIFFSGAMQNFVKAMFIAVLTFIVALLLPNGLQVRSRLWRLNFLEYSLPFACNVWVRLPLHCSSLLSEESLIRWLQSSTS